MPNFLSAICCASPSTAAWPGTRTPTTRSDRPRTRHCACSPHGSGERAAWRSPRRSTGSKRMSSPRSETTEDSLSLNADLVQHPVTHSPARRVVLDIDSSESPVHGTQEQSAYNGHFESVCYHPLFVFNQKGDCLAAKLRPGNVPSASGWEEVLLPVIDRHQDREQRVVVRADAAFALPA